jgi:hypothetical protein
VIGMSEYGDLVAAALHADAEAARAGIRAMGVTCPSCGVNMADLPQDHTLDLSHEEPYTAKCAAGSVAALADSSPMTDGEFKAWRDAANVSAYDDFRRREAEAFKRIIGEGPANFTGLLGVLNAETGHS